MIAAAAGVVALAGCASGPDDETTRARQTTPDTTGTTSLAPGASAVSPGGVTTAVNQPAESTEEEYFRACLTAKIWMVQQGGDR